MLDGRQGHQAGRGGRPADGLKDFTPFFSLPGVIRLVEDWARDGLLLIGDAAHTMSPAGAIGAGAPLAGGPRPDRPDHLRQVQRIREADVRTLHRLQLGAQRILLGQARGNALVRWLTPILLPLLLRSPLLPRVQRRVFFGVPLPPFDPAFRFESG